MRPDVKATLLAALIAGLLGVVLFSLFHALLVAPVPWLLVVGPLFAAPGSLLAAWAWHATHKESRPDGARLSGPLFGAALALALAPAGLLSLLVGPVEVADEGPSGLARALMGAALAVGVALGAGVGAWWSRSWRGALRFGLAALASAAPFVAQVAGTDLRGRFGVFFLGVLLTFALVGVAFVRLRGALARRVGAAA